MSTVLDIDPALVDAGTIARSTNRIVPPEEDPRTRRYGYNPGLAVMEVHSRDSGRQLPLIPAGILVRFDTSEMKMRDNSTDAADFPKKPLDKMGELLAALAVLNVKTVYGGEPDWGFRELTPLTVVDDKEALRIFSLVHPSFSRVAAMAKANEEFDAALQRGRYAPCPYELNVCVTCRRDVLKALDSDVIGALLDGLPKDIKRPDRGRVLGVRDILLDGVNALRNYWVAEFRSRVGEIAARSAGAQRGLQSLAPGDINPMQQLHELSPAEQAEQKAAVYAETQATALSEALDRQAAMFASVLAERQNNHDDPRVVQMAAELEALKQMVADLTGRKAAGEKPAAKKGT